MSQHIAKYEDIDLLEHLNGVPIKEIERRARPLVRDEISHEFKYDATEYPRTAEEEDYINLLRAVRSQIGFLGTNENLKDVLKRDWKTVSELDLTHNLIAQHLRQLLQICGESTWIPSVTYDLNTLPNNSLTSYKPQRFSIRRLVTRGYQYCLFTNLESDEPAEHWNDEYHIRNLDLDLELKIAGNCDVGVIAYIERYGFYEGNNELRVDPEKLFTVLTGKWTRSVLNQEIQNYESRIKNSESSMKSLMEQLENYKKQLEEKRANKEEEYEIEELEGEILLVKSEVQNERKQFEMLVQKLNKLKQVKI